MRWIKRLFRFLRNAEADALANWNATMGGRSNREIDAYLRAKERSRSGAGGR